MSRSSGETEVEYVRLKWVVFRASSGFERLQVGCQARYRLGYWVETKIG